MYWRRDDAQSDEDPRLRRQVALACGATLLLLAWGLWAFWPYIVEEHRRFEPWKAALRWAGDATALLWFLHFVGRYFVAGEPLGTRRLREGESAPRGWVVAATLLAAGLADLGMTEWNLRQETAGYEHARVTMADVLSVRRQEAVTRTHYRLRCRFKDEVDAVHETVVETWRHNGRRWRAEIDPALATALDEGTTPPPITIRHAPEWPERAWLNGQPGWENSFSYLALMILLTQGVTYALLLLLTVARRIELAAGGRVAWWSDLHRILPLAGEAAILGLMGTIHVAMGWRG